LRSDATHKATMDASFVKFTATFKDGADRNVVGVKTAQCQINNIQYRSYEPQTDVSICKSPVNTVDHQAEILQLLARAIDAKCRTKDNYQMFRCLEKALGYSHCSSEIREAVSRLIWSESDEVVDYLEVLQSKT